MKSNKENLAVGMSALQNRPKYEAEVITEQKASPSRVTTGRRVISISTDAYRKIKEYAFRQEISITDVVDRIVEMYNCR